MCKIRPGRIYRCHQKMVNRCNRVNETILQITFPLGGNVAVALTVTITQTDRFGKTATLFRASWTEFPLTPIRCSILNRYRVRWIFLQWFRLLQCLLIGKKKTWLFELGYGLWCIFFVDWTDLNNWEYLEMGPNLLVPRRDVMDEIEKIFIASGGLKSS